jgi:hypothetical protein
MFLELKTQVVIFGKEIVSGYGAEHLLNVILKVGFCVPLP